VPYEKGVESDETWRLNDWDEAGLRELLRKLRCEDKALLKLLAEAGGAMRQDRLMQTIPFLRGKTSASLRSLKSHINASCKGCGKAPILAVGTGPGSLRVHEINPRLGDLREVVIEEAKAFEIPEGAFE